MIDKKLKFEKFESKIVSKVENAMKFEKYRVNFKDKLESKPIISLGSEEYLLLRPLGEDFSEFLERTHKNSFYFPCYSYPVSFLHSSTIHSGWCFNGSDIRDWELSHC